ncbi:glycerophosphodiester phosphodiesterase GDPD1, chloroplastic-like [Mangifera indica]|uniref:glycerophosphodiester phosphodiesterase GDPD1, chloroplastic-like n=1 Tax=Mangifera indica TaxID=29780 RepID=UPI001CFAE2AB|nr:glycerophosphodiester phosphodiesterase GDPD1, chloroplastic-like [Mangifera indica]
MALAAVPVSDVPSLDQVPENASLSLFSAPFSAGVMMNDGNDTASFKIPKFLVVGHRGHGMNVLQSSDKRMKAIKENSIVSFNSAAKYPIDYIEFDVQVTTDDCPVIFHDDFILSEDNGGIFEKRVTELCLSEFLSYGPQKEPGKMGKTLLRKTKDGKIVNWNVETDDSLCTLQEAFQQVEPSLGFNIELKFDDHVVYQQDYLVRVLQEILKVVFEHAKDRPILFSTFQPDAALLVRKLQSAYPVFFLTDGGTEIFHDVRRNSLEEAIKVCLEGSLQGIVSEVKGVFRNPGAVTKIKEAKLSLLTYGKLNNVSEAVYMQNLMGIEGVIVDFVQEITEAVSDMIMPPKADEDNEKLSEGNGKMEVKGKPEFSKRELFISFEAHS